MAPKTNMFLIFCMLSLFVTDGAGTTTGLWGPTPLQKLNTTAESEVSNKKQQQKFARYL